MGFYDDLEKIIRDVMPLDAQILRMPTQDRPVFGISWKLNNDPTRPNKRSKSIRISISDEYATELPSQNYEVACDRISSFLQRKLARFDPDHNEPANVPPPVERWVIDTSLL